MSPGDAIFVINLASRADRRREVERELQRVGWDATFFPAIRPPDPAGFPSLGARGCFLSHLAVLKAAQVARVNRLILLEDDLTFAPGFEDDWRRVTAELHLTDWSIFYPGHILTDLPNGLTRLSPRAGVQCSHFIVINGRALARVVEGLETILSRPAGHPLGGPMHVDGAYSTIRCQNPALTTYAYAPALGYQRPSRTDIGDLRWFDRISALGPVIRIVRKLKHK